MPITKPNFDDVKHFHEFFGIGYEGPVRQLPPELKWRDDFLLEELTELKEAREAGDLAKQFDALIDLVYVALGTAYLQGFPWQNGWYAVHYANMMKRRAVDGEGRGTNDIRKPEGWKAPDIERILLLHAKALEERAKAIKMGTYGRDSRVV
jgi:predicted HAD superfamily Cof-like phosphohydrolase